ncbi:hypothetical protein BJX68DRAFT_248076 [Aspergillus pseudodeflectus]|uniref:Uncharacterized protein n=1 Tax=Aspergillus pseudodeflectus TaxID=176178 RepID=A0ABR4JGS2_9EURO
MGRWDYCDFLAIARYVMKSTSSKRQDGEQGENASLSSNASRVGMTSVVWYERNHEPGFGTDCSNILVGASTT